MLREKTAVRVWDTDCDADERSTAQILKCLSVMTRHK